VYAGDGRLREAINYNIDSLVVQDHMVVNREQSKEKALLYKNQFFPFDLQKETWFASKFSGVTDSTVILQEVFRKFQSKQSTRVLAKTKVSSLVFKDKIRRTVLNPFTRTEKEVTGLQYSIFAEGYGLVAWHNRNKSIHFRLERILSQKEWIQIIAR
jgi:maltooligosyltrehalose synthase